MEKKPRGYWTYERCKSEARLYDSHNSFRKHSNTAYQTACKNGWIDDFDWLRTYVRRWDETTVREEALRHKTRSEFSIAAPGAYSKALRMGWINDYTWLKRKIKWDEEACRLESKRFRTRTEFSTKSPSAYHSAWKHGWIDDYKWLEAEKKYTPYMDFSVHFAPNGQNVAEFIQKLKDYLKSKDAMVRPNDKEYVVETTLHHCFLTKEAAKAKGISNQICDYLDGIADNVAYWYGASDSGNVTNDRRLMLRNLKHLNGVAIFVGDIKEGVKEEYDEAVRLGITTVQIQ